MKPSRGRARRRGQRSSPRPVRWVARRGHTGCAQGSAVV